MRKLIVKLFALDYIVKVGGKTFNFLRAANIIFPTMAICGILLTSSDEIYISSTIVTILLSILFVVIFFGFFYFRFYPVKFYELDKSQKWQYGVSIHTDLTEYEEDEWNLINRNKELIIYNPIWIILINPIIMVLCVIYMYL